jgi:hypothetical protein
MLRITLVLCAAALTGMLVLSGQAPASTTLSGCIERDAASRAAVYKLIVKAPAGTRIYRLSAPPAIDLAAELGHTVEATGTVSQPSDPARGGPELAVQSLKRISDTCSN